MHKVDQPGVDGAAAQRSSLILRLFVVAWWSRGRNQLSRACRFNSTASRHSQLMNTCFTSAQ